MSPYCVVASGGGGFWTGTDGEKAILGPVPRGTLEDRTQEASYRGWRLIEVLLHWKIFARKDPRVASYRGSTVYANLDVACYMINVMKMRYK